MVAQVEYGLRCHAGGTRVERRYFLYFKFYDMSMSLNRAQIIGNLGKDPEVRATGSGKSVVNFSVATSSRWTDAAGQVQEKTEFHSVVVFGKLADICAQYLKKGMKVFIEGRLQTRDWQGEDGVKRYRTEIVADNMIMLGSKGAPASGASGAVSGGSMMDRRPAGIDAEAPADLPTLSSASAEGVSVEDLPF